MTETKIIMLFLMMNTLVILCHSSGKTSKNLFESNPRVIKNHTVGLNDSIDDRFFLNLLNEKKINDKRIVQECKPSIDNCKECDADNKCVKCNEDYFLYNSNSDNPSCVNLDELTNLTNMLGDQSLRRLISLPSFNIFNLSLFNIQDLITNARNTIKEYLTKLNLTLPSFKYTKFI